MSLWKNLGKGLEEMAKQSGVDLGEMGKQFQENMEEQKRKQAEAQKKKAEEEAKANEGLLKTKQVLNHIISDLEKRIQKIILLEPIEYSHEASEEVNILIVKCVDIRISKTENEFYFTGKKELTVKSIFEFLAKLNEYKQSFEPYATTTSGKWAATEQSLGLPEQINQERKSSREELVSIHNQYESVQDYYQTVTDFKAEDFTFPPCISDVLVKYDSWEIVNIANRNRTVDTFAEEWESFKGKKEYTEYTIVFRKK